MKVGDRVLIRYCGHRIPFTILAFTNGRAGTRLAILQSTEVRDQGLRFVPVTQLEKVAQVM